MGAKHIQVSFDLPLGAHQHILDIKRSTVFSGTCDHCKTGDHGSCWRSVCNCQHEGFTPDPNAQKPFGVAAGGSDEIKYYREYGNTKRGKGRGNGFRFPGTSGE